MVGYGEKSDAGNPYYNEQDCASEERLTGYYMAKLKQL